MKALLLLVNLSQKGLVLLASIAICAIPFTVSLSIPQTMISTSVLFLLMAIFSIYFDQRLIVWRKQLMKHKLNNKNACKLKFCPLHTGH